MHGSNLLLQSFQRVIADRSGIDALRGIAEADRAFAANHPGLYESFLPAPTEEDDPELYGIMAAPVFVVAGVMLDMGIPQERALHLVRALRALLHGFLDLEAKAGFGMPIDLETSFDVAVDVMLEAIKTEAGK